MKWIATIIRILFLGLFLYLTLTGNMMLWLAIFGVSLIAAIFFGRIYCGYICPMNTLMIPTEWLSKKLKLQTDKAPKWLKGGVLPWIALGVTIAVMMLSKRMLHINLPLLLIWLGASVLITFRYKPYIFHNLICPFGALQNLFGRFAIFSKKVNPDACIGCKKCEKVCPSMSIIVDDDSKKAMIYTEICHQCTNCTDVCPTDAIKYIKRK